MGLILECAEHIFNLSQLLQPPLTLLGTKEDALCTKKGRSSDLSKIFQFKLPPNWSFGFWSKKKIIQRVWGKAQPSSERKGSRDLPKDFFFGQMGQLLLFYKNISCIRVIDLQPTPEAINKEGICSLSKLMHTELSLKSPVDFRKSYKHFICYGYVGKLKTLTSSYLNNKWTHVPSI